MTELASFVDAHVGKRIRLLRGLRKFSQEKLAKALGITFQQVQKYERGANRVGAGRLYEEDPSAAHEFHPGCGQTVQMRGVEAERATLAAGWHR